MKILKLEYKMKFSDEDFETFKTALGIDSIEEAIGALKAVVKAQGGSAVSDVKITIKDDTRAPDSTTIN